MFPSVTIPRITLRGRGRQGSALAPHASQDGGAHPQLPREEDSLAMPGSLCHEPTHGRDQAGP